MRLVARGNIIVKASSLLIQEGYGAPYQLLNPKLPPPLVSDAFSVMRITGCLVDYC
jgi:hypothetical protein